MYMGKDFTHIFCHELIIKFCSRSLYTLWQKALCGWRIGQIGPWGEKIWSGQELYMWFSFDFNLEPRILIQGHWTPFDKRHSLGNSNVIYDRVGGGGGVGGGVCGVWGGDVWCIPYPTSSKHNFFRKQMWNFSLCNI